MEKVILKNRKRMAKTIHTITISLLLAACATVPITGRKQLSLVPQDQLLALGVDNYRQILKESKVSANTRQVEMVRNVGDQIAAAAGKFMKENGLESQLKNYQWEFNLIEDDKTINAFCLPGGKVAVYTGILPYTLNETGLAVVIGHEVAHALANHGGERMSQLLVTQLGGVTLSLALRQQPEQTRTLWMAAYGAGASIGVLLPYSRKHELEADRIGLIMMASAGYDPREAVPFWERMGKSKGARPPEFLSTHPTGTRRIKQIQSGLPEAMKYYKP